MNNFIFDFRLIPSSMHTRVASDCGRFALHLGRHPPASSKMADFDEELLALAGSGAYTGAASRDGSDMEQDSSDTGFRRGVQANESDAEPDDDDVDPYPYMGVYKDEDDREYIEDLPELEREEILAARRDEKSRREQKRSLLAMYQSQQGQIRAEEPVKKRKAQPAPKRRRPVAEDLISEDESEPELPESDAASDYEDYAPKKRRALAGSATSKRDKLKQLSARVKARKAGVADESSEEEPRRRGYASSDSESDFETYRRGARRRGSVDTSEDSEWDTLKEAPPLELLNALKLDRALVVNVMHRPDWEAFLRHKFIRFSWGPRLDDRGRPVLDAQGRQEEVFRIHEVEGVHHGNEFYELASGKVTNVRIQIRLFGEKKTVDLRYVSNRPFTQSEHDRWVASVRGSRGKFPSVAAMRRAEQRMIAYRDKAQTAEEIRTLLKNKKEAAAAFKAQQNEQRTQDPRAGPPGPPPPPPAGLVPQQSKPHPGRVDEKIMAGLNERHRKADRLRILEAEKRQAQAKRGGGVPASKSGTLTTGRAAPRTLDVPLNLGTAAEASLLPEGLKKQLVTLAEKRYDSHAVALLSVNVDVGHV